MEGGGSERKKSEKKRKKGGKREKNISLTVTKIKGNKRE